MRPQGEFMMVTDVGFPSAAAVFEAFTAYQRTGAIKAAIEMDLFTGLGEGLGTAEELAKRCQTSERGMRILCDYLVAIGFLVKADRRYGLTPQSAMFLDRRSPAYIGTGVHFLTSPWLVDLFKDVASAVRKGGTVMDAGGALAPEHPLWTEFARTMAPLARLTAQLLANLLQADTGHRCRVLDVAAGHGLFGIAVAQRNPRAEVVALDWPNVLAIAEENAKDAGVAERFRTISGDALTVDYGTGYDLVLLANFLHHLDWHGCEKLLGKVRRALKPSGLAVTLEFIPDEDRVTPTESAGIALTMLVSTSGGDAYTFSEYEEMFRRAGFSSSELHSLPPSFQRVVIAKK